MTQSAVWPSTADHSLQECVQDICIFSHFCLYLPYGLITRTGSPSSIFPNNNCFKRVLSQSGWQSHLKPIAETHSYYDFQHKINLFTHAPRISGETGKPRLRTGQEETGHMTPWNEFGNHMLLLTEGMNDTIEWWQGPSPQITCVNIPLADHL